MKTYDRRPESGMRDRWMVSYLDVLTIVLIFFVAVAAKSVMMKSPAAGAPLRPPLPLAEEHPGLQDVLRKLSEQGLDARLDLRMEKRGLVISLPQTILFQPGQDEVNPAALPVVGKVAQVLERIPNKISLIGHADPIPIHNRRFRSNWELAAGRGLQLLDLLTTRFGISETRLSTASYGSVDPKSSNDTADGRASNRRVEILILDVDP